MDRILSMIFRQLVRRGVDMGIKKGAEMMASRHSGADEADIQAQGKRTAKQARQMMRAGRRISRL